MKEGFLVIKITNNYSMRALGYEMVSSQGVAYIQSHIQQAQIE